jgi:hypothetical protein
VKAVAYECGARMGESTDKNLCKFIRKYLIVYLDIALSLFISSVK